MAKCKLDEVTELITENDHRAGLCLCSECTCQKHVCPYTHQVKSSPKFAYKSSYKDNYRKPGMRPRSAQEQRKYKPNLFKLECQTTSKNDFVPFETENYKSPKRSATPAYRPTSNKLGFRSKYQEEYKDWSEFLQSPQKPPPRSAHVTGKFNALSTYTVCFNSKDVSPPKPLIPAKNANPVDLGFPGCLTSTHRSAFEPRKSEPAKPIKAKDNSMLLNGYAGQYKSIFQASFSPRNTNAPLRRARKNVFS